MIQKCWRGYLARKFYTKFHQHIINANKTQKERLQKQSIVERLKTLSSNTSQSIDEDQTKSRNTPTSTTKNTPEITPNALKLNFSKSDTLKTETESGSKTASIVASPQHGNTSGGGHLKISKVEVGAFDLTLAGSASGDPKEEEEEYKQAEVDRTEMEMSPDFTVKVDVLEEGEKDGGDEKMDTDVLVGGGDEGSLESDQRANHCDPATILTTEEDTDLRAPNIKIVESENQEGTFT